MDSKSSRSCGRRKPNFLDKQGADMRPAPTEMSARRFYIPGLVDGDGEPLMVVVTGSHRRPVLRALATFAALARQPREEGER